jgi:hypothetical protein
LDLELLERQGYRIDERPGVLVSSSPHGIRELVPASEVRIRYVGAHVY